MWQTIMREELYEQVWSVPIWKLCEQYGLSDNGLRKVCKRLNVPVPSRGYWAKVEAGHKVRQAPFEHQAPDLGTRRPSATPTLRYCSSGPSRVGNPCELQGRTCRVSVVGRYREVGGVLPCGEFRMVGHGSRS